MPTRAPETYTLDEAVAEIHRLRALNAQLEQELQLSQNFQLQQGRESGPDAAGEAPQLRALEGFAQLIASARMPAHRREGGRTVPFAPPGRRIAGEALEVFPPASNARSGRALPPDRSLIDTSAMEPRPVGRWEAAARSKEITFDAPVDALGTSLGSLEGLGAPSPSSSTGGGRNDVGSRLAASGEEAVNRHLAEMRATINRIRENLRLGPARPQPEPPVDAQAPTAIIEPVQPQSQPAPSPLVLEESLLAEVTQEQAGSVAEAAIGQPEPIVEVALPVASEASLAVDPAVALEAEAELQPTAAPSAHVVSEPIAYVASQSIAWPPSEVRVASADASPAEPPLLDEAPVASSRWKTVVAVAAVLAGIAVVAWYWASPAQPVGESNPPSSTTAAPTQAPPSQPSEPAGQTVPADVTAPSGSISATPSSPAAVEAPAEVAAKPGELQLTTTREVWLFVVVDGQTVLETLAPAGRTFSFTMRREASVRAGDAGAVQATMGGGAPAALGADGSVLTRRFALAAGQTETPGAPQ